VTVRIGLTGPIGCGKSTVAGWLREQPGVVVIDADAVARDVTGPGSPAVARIVERFGPAVAAPGDTLDRAALSRIVFADPAALWELEAIVHPLVRPRIIAAIDDAETADAPAVVIEAIKLVEGGLADLCDAVWFVTCPEATQRVRLTGRGLDLDEAERRMAAQADLDARVRPRATRVVETGGSLEATRALVDAAYADDVGAAGRR
jgi:dephospho-CoA kinase